MMLSSDVYADFKLLVSNLGIGVVFYHNAGGSDFQVTAITTSGVGVRLTSSGSIPGSFGTDFPSAIALSHDVTPV